MTDGDANSPPAEHVVRVGGPVDELRISLAIYGEDLDPDEVTRLLCCAPTASHRRGDVRFSKKIGSSTVAKRGVWLLSVEGTAPQTADELTAAIFERISLDDQVWSALAARFDIQMRYGVFVNAWNRGLDLNSDLVQKLAIIRASLVFDIYAEVDDGPEESR